MPEVGDRFQGTVVKTTTFGAFVNLTPGRDGLVHISKLGKGKRLSRVEDAVNVGDKLEVEVEAIQDDPRGPKVSLKPVGEEWAIPEGAEVDDRPRDRGPRREGDRGPRRSGDRERRFRRPREREREPKE
jgi:polyribonucleotide nucleotidyltransferase